MSRASHSALFSGVFGIVFISVSDHEFECDQTSIFVCVLGGIMRLTPFLQTPGTKMSGGVQRGPDKG